MIVKLVFTNALPVPVSLHSDQATAQPLQAGQTLEMMFDLAPKAPDDIADLVLICEPG